MSNGKKFTHQRPEDLKGKEIFEIKPVILGGSPTDPENKTVLDREQHMEVVRWWNKTIRQIRSGNNGDSKA